MGWKYPVEEAVKFYGPDRMQQLINEGNEANLICDRGATRLRRTIFESPLHAALSLPKRNVETIKKPFDRGADVHLPQADGRTPLHLATRLNDGVIELLCSRGANVNAQADDSCTPTHDVLRLLFGDDDHTQNILDTSDNFRPFLYVRNAFGDIVMDLLQARGDDYFLEAPGKKDRFPSQASDTLDAWAALEITFNHRSTRDLSLRILDLASYWLCEYTSRKNMIAVNEHKRYPENVYLRAPPLHK
ncbi:hypothetical protein LTR78_008192 [Recurvomyces mirabilis]|uniref:Uncharacterized protein n=1 Tax=Recurvomyces mirabilis TaxID=574656 RepID=A0AAE0WJ04_9PEZI|nr:hypothetical protein LTR78_008192 [Recurvomyces mirabilis]KAK5150609.1 hypothetical protein LTS14_009892 [Recurvomyces mirabilis]